MGAGRRSVCFDSVDELAALMLPASVQTKNTFVHFQARDTFARRGTCSGGLIAMRRDSWDEADVRARRVASRGDARAATCQPGLAAVLRIPELAGGEYRRTSVESVESVESECPSPMSPLCICLETPTVLFVPSPRYSQVQPGVQCFAVQGFTQEFSQGCVTPVACSTPVHVSPCSTPRTTASPWALPLGQQTPNFPSPLSTPRSVALSQSSEELFPAVWQLLEASEPEQKRSRRNKVVIPAKESELTVMLRHLPLTYSPDALFAEFKEFSPFIDFYYLPTNFETKKNLGYAFLNFTDRAAAARFATFWAQSGIPESDDVPVQDARVQGYAANVDRFRSSSVMGVLTADLKPRIFCNGVQQPFPEAGQMRPVGPRFRPTGQ